jgi:anti-sigma factor RsiW
MRPLFYNCAPHRQAIALLTASALPDAERAAVENHLAACPGCRRYYHELKALTGPLKNWEENFARIHPSQDARRRWAAAIHAAAQPESVRRLTPAMAFCEWWRDVIWSSRRIWAGLAVAWLLILAGNFSLGDHPSTLARKSSPPSPEAIQSWRQQQRLLAELIGSSEAPATTPPKPFVPRPGSERRIELMTA